MMTDEIFEKVKEQLIEALTVDDDQVTPQARLRDDLNAESIDFLDIVFRLERAFGVKINREELFPDSIFQGDSRYIADGMVTPEGLSELKQKMPYADFSEFEKNPKFEAISELFTVDLIVRFMESKLKAAEGAA